MLNTVLAFKDYNVIKGIWGSPWVGMKYFNLFFDNPMFWPIVKNTVFVSGYLLIAGFPIPILLALMLNEVRNGRFKRLVQLVSFAPYFISTVVMVVDHHAVLWHRGSVSPTWRLNYLGFDSINFLGEPGMFRSIYVWSDIWQNAGYSAVIYLAALAGVDPTLYEAAEWTAHPGFRRYSTSIFPGILPTIIIVLILNVGNVMAIGFEKIYLLQNPLNLVNSRDYRNLRVQYRIDERQLQLRYARSDSSIPSSILCYSLSSTACPENSRTIASGKKEECPMASTISQQQVRRDGRYGIRPGTEFSSFCIYAVLDLDLDRRVISAHLCREQLVSSPSAVTSGKSMAVAGGVFPRKDSRRY